MVVNTRTPRLEAFLRSLLPRNGVARILRGAALGLALGVLPVSEPAALRATPATDAPADFTTTGAFPPDFLFGVATSSHQVEGNNTLNDWSVFEGRADVADSGEADREHDLGVLDQDLDLARSLGVNAYRFSIEWSRVEPSRDVFSDAELRHYQAVADHIRARGMVPVAGLSHFTLPSWVLDPNDLPNKPGWTSAATVQQFVEYARRMADVLGSRVDVWTTFNEPNGQIAGAYLSGAWSPGLSGRWDNYLQAANNLILAHRRAYRTLKQRDTIDADGDGKAAAVGLVQNMNVIFPQAPGTADDQDARDWDYVFHKQFLDAVTRVYDVGAFPVPAYAQGSRSSGMNCWDSDADYACDVLPSTEDGFLDFIGINYHNTAVSASSMLGGANPAAGVGLSGRAVRAGTLGDLPGGPALSAARSVGPLPPADDRHRERSVGDRRERPRSRSHQAPGVHRLAPADAAAGNRGRSARARLLPLVARRQLRVARRVRHAGEVRALPRPPQPGGDSAAPGGAVRHPDELERAGPERRRVSAADGDAGGDRVSRDRNRPRRDAGGARPARRFREGARSSMPT